ncbi:hypothetical protein AB8P51_14955 [Muriicola sp. SD30]|uniref:tetratricopeptide repeat protein n=1 Tax=Muriicola sp. SD30 TaxID=3240936 RepID=UPI00350EA6F6
MKKTNALILFLISFNLLGQQNIHNQNPNTLVEFSTVKNHFEELENLNNKKSDVIVNSATPGYLLLVKNTGEFRNIPPEKIKKLQGIFKSFDFKFKVEDLFENEALIKTEDGEYWFPIQKSLEAFWKEELTTSDCALIYIRAYGSTNDKESNKWLFTINSFNANFYDGLWEEALNSFNSNEPSNGLNCLYKLIELEPEDGRNYSMLGYYYYDQGFPSKIELLKKADSLYSKAIELSPQYSYVYYQKALAKLQLSEYVEAWYNIDLARKLGEENIENKKLIELENKLSYKEYLKTKN